MSPLKKRILTLLLLAALAAGVYQMLPGTRLRAKQEALLAWAQSGAPGDFADDFAAPDFQDQWGHRTEDVAGGIRALRFAFPALTITGGEPEFAREEASATVTQKIEVLGTGEPRRATVTFRWQRQSWLPWSWRLQRVEAPGLEW
jgi:hypothetical protein